MGELKLVEPTLEYENQVMEMRKVFLDGKETFAGCAGLEECNTYREWIDFDRRLSEKYKETYTPSTVYLGVRNDDNKVVGILDFRHDLNSDFMLKFGGHIGYSVVPDERRKGYATEMLRISLENCRKLGTKKVLITCDRENIASAKTILANGGILENEVKDEVGLSESGIIQRYWIEL